jgi:hypothetical protein
LYLWRCSLTVLTDKLKYMQTSFPSGFSSHIWYIPVHFLVGSTREVANGIRHKYTSQMIIFCYWIYLKLATSIYRYSLPICPTLFMEVWFQAVIYKPVMRLLELPCLFQFVVVDTVLLNWSRWTSSMCKFWKRKKSFKIFTN